MTRVIPAENARTRASAFASKGPCSKLRRDNTSTARGASRDGGASSSWIVGRPLYSLKVGDRIDAFVGRPRILEVAAVIEKRVGAPVAAKCMVDHSPPAPVVKRQPRIAVREPGSGRPTKRERRELDRLRGL